MSEFVQVKVSYKKTFENGLQKKVSELYLVDAINMTEAEERVIEELSPYGYDDFDVSALKKNTTEVIYSDSEDADLFFLGKIGIITIDEKTESEKITNSSVLIQARDFGGAYNALKEAYRATMLDYKVLSLSETKIIDVFTHK